MDALLKMNGLPVLTKREEVKLPPQKPRWLPSQWRKNIEARHVEKQEEKKAS